MFFLADNISLSRPKMKLLAYSIQFIFQLSMFVMLLCKSWEVLLMMKNGHFFKELGSEQAKSHLLHLFRFVFTMRFQMCPQMVCPKRGKVTLVAFVWLLATVCFQMCPQTVFMGRCKVALVAFVWLFPTVCFQINPETVCPREEAKSHWLHLFDFSPLCVFKCVLKLLAWEDA